MLGLLTSPEEGNVGTPKLESPVATSPRFVVAIGASAGGLHAIRSVLVGLAGDFPAAVVVVQHVAPWYRSHIAEILDTATKLKVKEAQEGDRLGRGAVFIAPPNRHLLVGSGGTLTLSFAELVHSLRPSADMLFESAATNFGERAIAVVLSGTGSDGAMGIRAVKKMGGRVIAQDDSSAEFSGMPHAAIQTGVVDFVLPLDQIAGKLIELTTGG